MKTCKWCLLLVFFFLQVYAVVCAAFPGALIVDSSKKKKKKKNRNWVLLHSLTASQSAQLLTSIAELTLTHPPYPQA